MNKALPDDFLKSLTMSLEFVPLFIFFFFLYLSLITKLAWLFGFSLPDKQIDRY